MVCSAEEQEEELRHHTHRSSPSSGLAIGNKVSGLKHWTLNRIVSTLIIRTDFTSSLNKSCIWAIGMVGSMLQFLLQFHATKQGHW